MAGIKLTLRIKGQDSERRTATARNAAHLKDICRRWLAGHSDRGIRAEYMGHNTSSPYGEPHDAVADYIRVWAAKRGWRQEEPKDEQADVLMQAFRVPAGLDVEKVICEAWAGWKTATASCCLTGWLANMPVHIGKLQSAQSTNKHVKEAERLVRDPNRSLHQLRFEGYAVISRRHRLVARVDRADWREVLARDHAPWSPNGEGMRWAMTPGMDDFYRRSHLCKDRMVIAENRWEAALRILPNSGSPEAPQDYRDFKL